MRNFRPDDYEVKIFKDFEEGGYYACMPQFDLYADGITPEQALDELYTISEDLINIMIEDGKSLPKPKAVKKTDSYSGRFVLRLPKSLHRDLVAKSEEENISLNQACIYLLQKGLAEVKQEELIQKMLERTQYKVCE